MSKTIFNARCDVTSYDLHIQVRTDGRRRGLWIWIEDTAQSPATNEAGLLTWENVAKLKKVLAKAKPPKAPRRGLR